MLITIVNIGIAKSLAGVVFPIGMMNIPAGFLTSLNPGYYEKSVELYGLTAEQIGGINLSSMYLNNLFPVTLGNMAAGMFLISLPLYILHKDVIFRDPTHREYLKTEKQNAAQGQEKHKV